MSAGPSGAPGNRSTVRGSPRGRQGGAGEARGCHSPGPRFPSPRKALLTRASSIPEPRSTGTMAGTGTPSGSGVTRSGAPACRGAGPPTWVKVAAVPSRQRRTWGGHRRRRARGRDPGTPRHPREPPALRGPPQDGARRPWALRPARTRPRRGPSPSTPPGPGRSLRPRAAKGGRRPGHPGTAAQGRLDLPRGPPRSPRPPSRCPRSPRPHRRRSGAPRPLPVRPAPPLTARPRHGPRAPDAIFPPRPTHRARGHAHRGTATPTAARGHAYTPRQPVPGAGSRRRRLCPGRCLAPAAVPGAHLGPAHLATAPCPGVPGGAGTVAAPPRCPRGRRCPGDPSLLGHARCRRSRGYPGGAAPGTGAGSSARQVLRCAGPPVTGTHGIPAEKDPTGTLGSVLTRRWAGLHPGSTAEPWPQPGLAPAPDTARGERGTAASCERGPHCHPPELDPKWGQRDPRSLYTPNYTATPRSWTLDPKWGQSDPQSLCAPSRTATPRNWTLDPAGDWHYRWISLMVLPILYNWVVLILRCCFPEVQEAHAGLWQALDGLSDVLYLLDIAVHLHTGFLEDGILVRDARRTRRRYLGSWSFPWDVVAVLPTELLCLLPGVPRVPGVPAARANRCLRVPRLFEAFDRCETRTGWPNAFRMAKLMLYLLLGIHWHACLYFALSARLGLGADPWVCPSSPRLLRRYLHSFYISTLVLAMVGDTPPAQREEELLFLTAGFLLAVLGFATITGSISTVIVNLSSAGSALYPAAGPVRRYLRARGAGGRLAARVARWHQHLRAQRKPPAEWRVLRHLPRGLRAEVAASVHLAALRRVGLFRGWERGVLRQLVLRLRPQVFGPGEFVCRRGDVGREMYFIREGRLAVLAADGVTQLAVLGAGLYFGEISLINIKGNVAGNRRTANILSIGYSDLFCLGKEDLAEVLAEFPSARAAMEAKGRELLLRMGQLDTGAEAAALAAEAEAERRLRGLETALEGLQTRAARLLAQLEASALRMALRVRRLEGRLQLRDGAGRDRAGRDRAGRERAVRDGAVRDRAVRDRAVRADGTAGTASPQQPPGPQGPTGGQAPPRVQDSTEARDVLRAHGPPRAPGPSEVRGAPRAQEPDSAGGQGRTGMQGPSKAQGAHRAQGPSDVPGAPKAHGTPTVQGPHRARGRIGARGPRGMYGPGEAQAPLRAQGLPRARRQIGTRGPSAMYGPGRAQALRRARGPSGAQRSTGAQDVPGAQGVPRGAGVPRD
ncbi:cyclic nucleotide-gated cation channel alpha-4 [Ammospiza nelsoni]|uniref:cyclic nucleotide-gated cation channel alpha-4 n=1 Tax=Ammospiza nelsoni TaxID=2857394 RepID=UPI002869DF4F|nr:cyclic nucleotide-gated cation channel alpha-4 [Ammospiza nelsoni]